MSNFYINFHGSGTGGKVGEWRWDDKKYGKGMREKRE